MTRAAASESCVPVSSAVTAIACRSCLLGLMAHHRLIGVAQRASAIASIRSRTPYSSTAYIRCDTAGTGVDLRGRGTHRRSYTLAMLHDDQSRRSFRLRLYRD